MTHISKQKSLSISIIGKTNSGKSSLLNKLIGANLSIVTSKVQTTRNIITGIITINDTQLIILDTPGIFDAKKNIEKKIIKTSLSTINYSDLVLFVIDCSKQEEDLLFYKIEQVKSLSKKIIFIINKIDLSKKYINYITNNIKSNFLNPIIFEVSVLKNLNIPILLNYILKKAIKSPWLYKENDLTNLPMKFIAAEITREQLLKKLSHELPYNLTVYTEKWQELSNGEIIIHQVIVVSKNSYKKIILGKNGSKIKSIGSNSRIKIAELFKSKIHLFLFVKIEEFWQKDRLYQKV